MDQREELKRLLDEEIERNTKLRLEHGMYRDDYIPDFLAYNCRFSEDVITAVLSKEPFYFKHWPGLLTFLPKGIIKTIVKERPEILLYFRHYDAEDRMMLPEWAVDENDKEKRSIDHLKGYRSYLDLYYENYAEHLKNGSDMGAFSYPYAIHFNSEDEQIVTELLLKQRGYGCVTLSRSRLILINPDFRRYGFHTKAVKVRKRDDTYYSFKDIIKIIDG